MRLSLDFVRSAPEAVDRRADFADVERFVLFIGHRRSGHSLVGSLLNAHPEIVISHQLNALVYVLARFPRDRIYALILDADRRFAAQGRTSDTGRFDYSVPGEWQGRYRRLRVIGDKRGGTSRALLSVRPAVLDRLRHTVGVPLRIVHVVRNPYDNISTMARRNGTSLPATITTYFDQAAAVGQLRAAAGPEEWIDIRHEDVIADTDRALRRLCAFVGVEPSDDYLRACASIVYDTPHRSRVTAPWEAPLIADVAARMGDHPALAGYAFAEPPTSP